jgi:rhomboid protease GluP
LLSAPLLHADPFHLAFNGIALFMAGVCTERLLGRAWLLALFFLGALGGSLLSIALSPPAVVSTGASGAIVGLLAVAFVISFRVPEGPERIRMQTQVLQILVPALLPIAVRSGERIDFAAHLGGALTGFLSAGVIVASWPRDAIRPRLGSAAVALSAIALAAFAWSGTQSRAGYREYAPAFVLIPTDKLPKTRDEMVVQASSLLSSYPRDPRAHAFSAMARVRANDAAGAEADLRAALAEKRILQTAFTPELEVSLRSMLARILLEQKRVDAARRELQPVCDAGPNHTVPESVRELRLCP